MHECLKLMMQVKQEKMDCSLKVERLKSKKREGIAAKRQIEM